MSDLAPADDPRRATDGDPAAPDPGAAAEELLVEEVSIDGMCGVY